jgi:hypothetical protein
MPAPGGLLAVFSEPLRGLDEGHAAVDQHRVGVPSLRRPERLNVGFR